MKDLGTSAEAAPGIEAPPREREITSAPMEGITLGTNAFTGTGAKELREPRPPLFYSKFGMCGHIGTAVLLSSQGGRVVVLAWGDACHVCGWPNKTVSPGDFFPGAPQGPAYTGQISPSMWAVIRKWWTP